MRKARIAVVQIESHPAACIGHIHYLDEPFIPKDHHSSLSAFFVRGLPVVDLQRSCREAYVRWQRSRVGQILAFLKGLDPRPDLLIFPEYSIPVDLLEILAQFSAETDCLVLAGTHTPQRIPSARRIYRAIGVPDNKLTKVIQNFHGAAVLPAVEGGGCTLYPKLCKSPFERTVLGPEKEGEVQLRVKKGRSFNVLVAICSEALRLHSVAGKHDLAAVLSYDQTPSQFESFLRTHASNRKPALYCNDGKIGGSTIEIPIDDRGPNWLLDALGGALPPGESVLVADIELEEPSVDVAVANPGRTFELVALASIIYEQERPGGRQPELLSAIGALSPPARVAELTRLEGAPGVDEVQRVRARHLLDLERRGLDAAHAWRVLGAECLIRGEPSLGGLEAKLAAECVARLPACIPHVTRMGDDKASGLFLAYMEQCQKTAGKTAPLRVEDGRIVEGAGQEIIDRETDARTILAFLDNASLVVLEITGLEQVGKSSAIRKALAQTRGTEGRKITIGPTSSAEYIVLSVLRWGTGASGSVLPDPVKACAQEDFRSSLARAKVVVVEHADLCLTRGGAWRDDRIRDVFLAIIAAAEELGVKVIIEARRQIPLDLPRASIRGRHRIRGLEKEAEDDGVALLDAQLRRLEMAPASVPPEIKRSMVSILGGHPGAIALAADAIYENDARGVLDALKARRGPFLSYVERLLVSLNLSDEERMVMQLLCLPRIPVPREVVLASCAFAAGEPLRNLVTLAAVDVECDGTVAVAGVLHTLFDAAELDPEVQRRFHEAAAKALELRFMDDQAQLAFGVEAEYHARLAGSSVRSSTSLLDAAMGQVNVLIEKEDYESAGRVLDELVERPGQVGLDILRLAALADAKRNRFESAMEKARQVFTRDRNDDWLLTELARTALSLSRDDIGGELVRIARMAAMDPASILLVEGRIWLRRGDLVAAEGAFRKASEATKRNAWPFFYLGRTYMRSGRMEEAIDALERGVKFFYTEDCRSRTQLRAMQTLLGEAYVLIGDVKKAEAVIVPLTEEYPNSPEVIRAFAGLELRRGGKERARQAIEKLRTCEAETRYDRARAHLHLGLYYLGIGEKEQAGIEFDKAHSEDRSDVFVMLKRARTMFEIAQSLWADGDDLWESYARDCGQLVKKVLGVDKDNPEGLKLQEWLEEKFGMKL